MPQVSQQRAAAILNQFMKTFVFNISFILYVVINNDAFLIINVLLQPRLPQCIKILLKTAINNSLYIVYRKPHHMKTCKADTELALALKQETTPKNINKYQIKYIISTDESMINTVILLLLL